MTSKAMFFSPSEADACRQLVDLALVEDLASAGDLTSQLVIPPDLHGQAVLVARSPGVLAGLDAAALVFSRVDARLVLEPHRLDGSALHSGDRLASVHGPVRALLTGERTALNFLQRLSGVATLTRRFVQAVAGQRANIFDTRKTTPGWRLLEKYAVRCGGGHNHRLGLYDGVLIKDNHLAARGLGKEALEEVARSVLAQRGNPNVPLEVEVDTLEQFDAILAIEPDIILLDNMTPEQMREAVRRRDAHAPRVQLEASGRVTLATVRAIAASGVERISVGALTHSAPALDIALDYVAA